MERHGQADGGLPTPASVLAVCAHPDDESFGLGAVLSAFADGGVRTSVLCLTHGEASTLGVDGCDLHRVRADELGEAAGVLGVDRVRLLGYADGRVSEEPLDRLSAAVGEAMEEVGADLLLVFDEGGITGHPDHVRATDAALAAAGGTGVPVLAWTLHADVAGRLRDEFAAGFVGRPDGEIHLSVDVDRSRQHRAIRCHGSQATDNPVLWRRLELQGDLEHLRWLAPPVAPEDAPDAARRDRREVREYP